MIEIHLIRHGKTHANEKRLYCGHTDIPLSENGAEEVGALRDKKIYPAADAFYSSGLLRAGQTLKIIYGDVEYKIAAGLSEYNFGAFEMKGYEELKKRDDYLNWINDSTGEVACPGGESGNGFSKRVIGEYMNIVGEARSNGTKSTAVFAHGGVITRLMDYLFPGERNFYEWQPGSGRGYTVFLDGGHACGYRAI